MSVIRSHSYLNVSVPKPPNSSSIFFLQFSLLYIKKFFADRRAPNVKNICFYPLRKGLKQEWILTHHYLLLSSFSSRNHDRGRSWKNTDWTLIPSGKASTDRTDVYSVKSTSIYENFLNKLNPAMILNHPNDSRQILETDFAREKMLRTQENRQWISYRALRYTLP